MSKPLKSITTERFSLSLFQDEKGKYYIRYENFSTEGVTVTAYLDYSMATFAFDHKINQLEGN